MNYEPMYKKLVEAGKFLGNCCDNMILDANGNRGVILKDFARLKTAIAEAELLLGVQPKEDIAPPLQKTHVSDNEVALPLLRELVMRGQFAFPENEDDLKWFDEGINHQFMEELMTKLSLGIVD